MNIIELPRRIVQPSRDSVSAITTAASAIRPAEDRLSDWYRGYICGHTKRFAVDLELIGLLDPGRDAQVLDVGAIPPVLLAAMKQEGRTAKGLDIEPSRFRGSIDDLGLDLSQCDIENEPVPFPSDSFQMVLFNEVFEHLRIDLIATMRELVRVIAPGGLLVLSTPNGRSSRATINFVIRSRSGWCGAGDLYGQYEKLEKLGHMGHVREYTVKDVSDFLTKLGLTTEAVVWRGEDPSAFHRGVAAVVSSFSPFMTLVMRKV